jgi:CRISPR-associated protein Cas5t
MRLRIVAPFAAFRPLSAGSFRPSTAWMPPSTAYGLLLNVAGIESRLDDGRSPMTIMKPDLPIVEIALGAASTPEVQSLYQQLHNYPVGDTGKERVKACKGAKYNIQPVRREFVSGVDMQIAVRGNDELIGRIREGLEQGCQSQVDGQPRYGIPFLGDNNFMIDVIREEVSSAPVLWLRKLGPKSPVPFAGATRLTIWIDRADMTGTHYGLFAPSEVAQVDPPAESWVRVGPPAEAVLIPDVGQRKKER